MYELKDEKNKYNVIKLATKNKDIDKIFCLILYTDKNPFVKKCLKDEDYWDSLNARSGETINVYAIRPKAGKYSMSSNMKNGMPVTNFMNSYWDEPSDNTELISELGLSDTKDLPMIYFLNNDFGDVYTVPIEGNNVEEVYNDIEKIITNVINLEKKDKLTFENLKSSFLKQKAVKIIKKNFVIIKIAAKLITEII